MSKAYTPAQFTDQITSDRTWRLKEISDLKSAAINADKRSRPVLLRALVTICYAHWEGYVRFAASKYLEHIAIRKLSFEELAPQFYRNYFLPRLQALAKNRVGLKEQCSLIDDVLNSASKRFTRVNEDLINTKSNLNFAVLDEICTVCAIELSSLSDKETFIDVLLLKRRNSIAHGEESFIQIDDMDEITDTTVELMRTFGDALENNLYSKAYIKASLAH